MKTCEDCGCRIYEYGCVNCNEIDYIDMQDAYNESNYYTKIEEDPMPKDGRK